MKSFLAFFTLMLICCLYTRASDMALYAGNPNTSWYDVKTMFKDVEKIKANVENLLEEVVYFKDDELRDFEDWTHKNLTDGEMDIIWLNGCMPSFLYPNPNKMPHESLAEEWLDRGNMFINVADWFAYTTYETGIRGADNGAAGAENILNLPGIIWFGDNTKINITNDGRKYMPSLLNHHSIISDRPIIGTAIKPPWEVAEEFGVSKEGAMDPCVIYNVETNGYVAFINQAYAVHSVDRAEATIEFINNWVAEKVPFGEVDTEPPVGSITINNRKEYTNTTRITLLLEGQDDDSGIASVGISGDVADPFVIDWPGEDDYISLQTSLIKGDGKKAVYATFSDNANNKSVSSDTIILDTTQPTSLITSPTPDKTIGGIYNVEGTADDLNFREYLLYYYMYVPNTDGVWNIIEDSTKTKRVINGILGKWDTTKIPDGIYTIYLDVWDKAGNRSISRMETIVDNRKPTSIIASPNQDEVISGNCDIKGIADDSNFEQYVLEFGTGSSPPAWYDIDEHNPRRENVRRSGTLGSWDTTNIIDGLYTIRLTVEDKAGNISVSSVIVTVQNEDVIFKHEYVYDFEGGNTDDFQTHSWNGGSLPSNFVFDMCDICEEEDLIENPNLCDTCSDFGNVVKLEPDPGTGLGIRLPSTETGLKLSADVIVVRAWILSHHVEIGYLITDRAARDGENPMQFEYFGIFLTRIGQSWFLTERTNGSPSFNRIENFRVEQSRWYNVAFEFRSIGQGEFDCHLYIDGINEANIRLNKGTIDLNNSFVYLIANRDINDNTLATADDLTIEFRYECTSSDFTDQFPPSGSLVVNNDEKYTSSRIVMLNLTSVTDNYGGSGVSLVGIEGNIQKDPTISLVYDWPGTNEINYDLPGVILTEGDGDKRVFAIFVDSACNPSPATYDDITLDETTPNITITQPSSGANVSGVVRFSADVTDNIGINKVEFQYNGRRIREFTESSSTAVKSKLYSIDWDTTSSSVVNGPYSLAVLARDLAGNRGTTSVPVNVSNIQVWPGDTNNDTVVNGKDVLPIGEYWGITGDARGDISCEWAAQISPKWDPEEATYANANGDSIIDEMDVQCIISNWGESRTDLAPGRSNPMTEYLQYAMVYEEILEYLESEPDTEPIRLIREMLRDIISMSRGELIPDTTAAFQNYPNPFNPDTWIPYQLKEDSEVIVSIFGVSGELIRKLDLGYKPAGFYLTKNRAGYWNGRNSNGELMASGLYFYMIQAGDFTTIRKIALVK